MVKRCDSCKNNCAKCESCHTAVVDSQRSGSPWQIIFFLLQVSLKFRDTSFKSSFETFDGKNPWSMAWSETLNRVIKQALANDPFLIRHQDVTKKNDWLTWIEHHHFLVSWPANFTPANVGRRKVEMSVD